MFSLWESNSLSVHSSHSERVRNTYHSKTYSWWTAQYMCVPRANTGQLQVKVCRIGANLPNGHKTVMCVSFYLQMQFIKNLGYKKISMVNTFKAQIYQFRSHPHLIKLLFAGLDLWIRKALHHLDIISLSSSGDLKLLTTDRYRNLCDWWAAVCVCMRVTYVCCLSSPCMFFFCRLLLH